jgi:acetyl-CoA carboxylase carboxyl transferase subunit beta
MAFFKRNRFFGGARSKTPIPDGLWMKCPSCEQIVYRSEVEAGLNVCPHCGHHHRLGARERIAMTVDEGSFTEAHANVRTVDPLHLHRRRRKLRQPRRAHQRKDRPESEALLRLCRNRGRARRHRRDGLQFHHGVDGLGPGREVQPICADAVRERVPLLMFAASGGARMQEGTLALMQMAKTAASVRTLNDNGIPYIVVLTDPTSGGVFASFASLGDVILAEPKAYIGFAGARLIEGALRVKLPEGFQRAEYQFENGFH